jgi:hypothetical protein
MRLLVDEIDLWPNEFRAAYLGRAEQEGTALFQGRGGSSLTRIYQRCAIGARGPERLSDDPHELDERLALPRDR